MDLLLLSLIQCFTPRHFISVRIPSTILHLINGYLVGTTTLHPIFSLTSHLTSQAFPHTDHTSDVVRVSECGGVSLVSCAVKRRCYVTAGVSSDNKK